MRPDIRFLLRFVIGLIGFLASGRAANSECSIFLIGFPIDSGPE